MEHPKFFYIGDHALIVVPAHTSMVMGAPGCHIKFESNQARVLELIPSPQQEEEVEPDAELTAHYKGYTAEIWWSEEDAFYVGSVLGLTNVAFGIRGDSLEEAQADFEGFIDDYLEWGKEDEGFEPEQPKGNWRDNNYPGRRRSPPGNPTLFACSTPDGGRAFIKIPSEPEGQE